jgi:hypothetical protein
MGGIKCPEEYIQLNIVKGDQSHSYFCMIQPGQHIKLLNWLINCVEARSIEMRELSAADVSGAKMCR